MINSLLPYAGMWVLMYWSLDYSYWLTLALSIPAGGLLVRIFIIFHDCTHGAFFQSKRANGLVGYVTGVLTLTPFDQWRREHAMHHATSGDLDRRHVGGEIWTMTVKEYLAAPKRTRFAYRVYRNPIVMFLIGPIYIFAISHRFGQGSARGRENWNVRYTNLGIAGLIALMVWLIGWVAFLKIYLPIFIISGAGGVWLFYVQHQFEEVYWERHEQWRYFPAAMHGSSFYRLPRVLQWFTGNIGYHHIHHLSPRIPNYMLQRCHEANPDLCDGVPAIDLRTSLKSAGYRLWDEKSRKMIGFGALRHYRRAENAG
ncbi:MAG: fatty acid desaturase [Acidobacteria bacterium]|nr:fatty acid desaturase [Acidobacteriota bacterium]